MKELEEQQRREMVERQEEDMIRDIWSATGESAQMLRANYRRAYNGPSRSQTADRRDDIDVLAQDFVHVLSDCTVI